MAKKTAGKSSIFKTKLALISFGILLIGGLVFSVFTLPTGQVAGGADISGTPKPNPWHRATSTPSPSPTSTPSPTPTPTSTPTPTPTPIPFEKTEDEEIIELVEGYCNAKLSGDIEKFRPYVNNIDNININYYINQYKLAKSMSNFEIYTVPGKYGLSYISFVVYDLEIMSIDTTSLEATLLQIVESEPDDDGNTHLVINTELLTDEQREFQLEVQSHDDFIQLYRNFWERDLDKIRESETYAKVWYNLFSAGIDDFKTKYPEFEDFKLYITEKATLDDFLVLRQSMHADYSGDGSEDNPDDEPEDEPDDTGSGSGAGTGSGSGSGTNSGSGSGTGSGSGSGNNSEE